MLELHHGQGMEIWWRDNFVSPSEDEYRQMVMRKCGGLFSLAVRLMQLFSSEDVRSMFNFDHLCQIRDDYCNLISKEYANNKSYCEDLTEGKFSFPILHAVNTHESDTRIIHILKQRTQDVELKRYCVQLLHEFGSIEYTRRICQDLAKQVYDEIDVLGGNNYLENLVRNLMEVFRGNDDDGYDANGHHTRPYEMNGRDDDIEGIDTFVTDQIDDDDQQDYDENIDDLKKIPTQSTATTNGRFHT
jgi:geranylgeranyl diphosphate synthase, type III